MSTERVRIYLEKKDNPYGNAHSNGPEPTHPGNFFLDLHLEDFFGTVPLKKGVLDPMLCDPNVVGASMYFERFTLKHWNIRDNSFYTDGEVTIIPDSDTGRTTWIALWGKKPNDVIALYIRLSGIAIKPIPDEFQDYPLCLPLKRKEITLWEVLRNTWAETRETGKHLYKKMALRARSNKQRLMELLREVNAKIRDMRK